MAAKKTNWYIYAALAAAAITGYFIWNKSNNGNGKEPGAEPTPEPKPEPSEPKPKIAGKPNKAKATQLQELIVRRFEQLNRANELPKNFADGIWGDKSDAKAKELRPQTFANFGNVTSENVDKWIAAFEADVAAAAKEIQEQKAKQTTAEAQKVLANKLETWLNQSKTATIRLLNDVVAIRHEYDAARGRYVVLGDKTTYRKNDTFKASNIINRGNGQIGIKEGQFRYFINADQFITNSK